MSKLKFLGATSFLIYILSACTEVKTNDEIPTLIVDVENVVHGKASDYF